MKEHKGYQLLKRLVGVMLLATVSASAYGAAAEPKNAPSLLNGRIQTILNGWTEKHGDFHPSVEAFRGDRDAQVPLLAKIVKEEGTLFFSDSPEYVHEEGILCTGTMDKGEGRIYFYHVNETPRPMHMAIVVRNLGNQENTLTIKNTLLSGPSPEYFEVGRSLSLQELASHNLDSQTPKEVFETDAAYQKEDGKTYVLKPFERREIWADLEKVNIPPDALISGIVNFETTGPLEVSVMMLEDGHNASARKSLGKILPHTEGHLRGTFIGAKREIEVLSYYDPTIGTAYIELLNGREMPFLKGCDETKAWASYRFVPEMPKTCVDPSENTGDYGVEQHITIHTKNKGYYDLYFNPLGGAYAGYLRVTNRGTSKIHAIPDRSLAYVGHKTIDHMVYIGTYKGGPDLEIDLMSAGASNLPVRFILYPSKKKD